MTRLLIASVLGLAALSACETMAPDAEPAPSGEEQPAETDAPRQPETAADDAPGAASFTLRLAVAEPEGTVYVSLIDNEADWDSDAEGRGFTRDASSGTVTIEIEDVRPGTYAVKAFQDTDGNGELSTNALGIPNEPYGFSNNAPARFGPPGFGAASFTVDGEGMTQEITLD